VKQQQVAMKLAKGAGGRPGSERYMWWAVTSLLLQARAAAAGDCAQLLSSRICQQTAASSMIRASLS